MKVGNPPKVRFRDAEPLQDYYSDPEGNLYSVAKLIDDTKKLKPFKLPLAGINLANKPWDGLSIFNLAFHCKKVMDADLTKPIILDWEGHIADGRHRVIKALALGKKHVLAVRMQWKPEPCRKEAA